MTELEIQNKSLRIIGAEKVTQAQLDGDLTEQARIMNDIYESVREELLEEHPWNFAIKRATLTELGGKVETWTAEGTTNVWQAALTTEPASVDFDGTEGTEVASAAACTATGYWFWESDILYVYSTSDPDTAFTSPGIEAVIPEFEFDHAYALPTDCLRVIRTTEEDDVFVIEGARLLTNETSIKIKYIAQITTTTEFSTAFIMAFCYKLAAEMTIATTNDSKLRLAAEELFDKKLSKAKAVDAQEGSSQKFDEDSWETARE